MGVHDGAQGVQRNAFHYHREDGVTLGVNLEGEVDDGWRQALSQARAYLTDDGLGRLSVSRAWQRRARLQPFHEWASKRSQA